MSGEATIWAWKQPVSSATTKLVLLCLADIANEELALWPSQSTIAKRCLLSVRAVGDSLRTLEESGLITRSKRMSGTTRLSDLIRLVATPITLFSNEHEPGSSPPTNGAEGGPTECADLGVEHAPGADMEHAPRAENPSIEPFKEESSFAPAARDLDVLAARIYEACAPIAKKRCGEDPGRIAHALREAAARGEDPVKVTEAMVAFMSSGDQQKEGGKYAPGPHRAIEDNRWVNFVGRAAPAPASRDLLVAPRLLTEITEGGVTYAIPPGGQQDPKGTIDNPGIRLQLHWMEGWKTHRSKLSWYDRAGPMPGEPGCRIWPSVLAAYGVQPAEEGSDDRAG